MNVTLRAAALAATTLLLPAAAQAVVYPVNPTPVSLTTPRYTQDFDTLSSTSASSVLPAGWQVSELGGNANGTYAVGTGSSDTGNAYSFGAAGSSDRALGSLTSGNLNPISYGAFFTNDLGGTIDSLTITYTGEQWRNGTTPNADTLAFEYSLDATSLTGGSWTALTSLNFTGPVTGTTAGAINGNLAANRLTLSDTLAGLGIADGASFAIRWTDRTAATGSNDGLAVDDFSLTATLEAVTAVPEPASWALMIGGFGFIGSAMRRRRVFANA